MTREQRIAEIRDRLKAIETGERTYELCRCFTAIGDARFLLSELDRALKVVEAGKALHEADQYRVADSEYEAFAEALREYTEGDDGHSSKG
jgi:predicted ATPase